ncbi:uncharacterized protein [Acropora muricata]
MAQRNGSIVKAHVTFGDCKRIVTLNNGDGLAELHQGFLQTFHDELPHDAPQVEVKFQRHNDEFDDYEDITPDVKLMEHTKMKAFIATSKNEESKKTMVTQISNWEEADHERKTSPFGAYHCEPLITLYLGVSQHAPIPLCTAIQSFASNFEKSHPIKKNVTYQLWSLMKQGVIVLNDSTPGSVYTDGAVGAVDSNNSVVANHVVKGHFQLEFNAANGPLSITAADKGTTISVTASPGKIAYFEPIYYWSFTMFRCSGRTPVNGNTAMYLGCNQSNNLAVLVQVKEPYDLPGYYPDPRILFIASRA